MGQASKKPSSLLPQAQAQASSSTQAQSSTGCHRFGPKVCHSQRWLQHPSLKCSEKSKRLSLTQLTQTARKGFDPTVAANPSTPAALQSSLAAEVALQCRLSEQRRSLQLPTRSPAVPTPRLQPASSLPSLSLSRSCWLAMSDDWLRTASDIRAELSAFPAIKLIPGRLSNCTCGDTGTQIKVGPEPGTYGFPSCL